MFSELPINARSRNCVAVMSVIVSWSYLGWKLWHVRQQVHVSDLDIDDVILSGIQRLF